ncbi:MAG: hypothetical protein ACOCWE_06035 [Bacillota bacterium]
MLSRKRVITIIIILLLVFVYIDARLITGSQGMEALFNVDLSHSGNFNWSSNGDYQYRSEVSGTEEYGAADLNQLLIENRFGEVDIIGEPRDDVSIEYKIEVRAATEEILEETIEEVALELNQTDQVLEIRTARPDRQDRVNISTYLTVRAPEELAVDLQSRFDDINIENIDSNLIINNSYGDVELSEITGPLDIEASFSNYKINSVQEKIVGNFSYTDVTIDQLKSDLELDLEFSDLDLYLENGPEAWSYDLRTNYGAINSRYDFQVKEDGTEAIYSQSREGVPLLEIEGRFTDIIIH